MFHQQQVSEGENVWIKSVFKRNVLDDETNLLPIATDERVFHTFELEKPQPTSWVNFPTTLEPNNKFKYASFDIYFSQDTQFWSRQTYSLLDFLGDLGGLYEAQKYIFGFLVSPISAFALKVATMANF